MDTNLQGNIGEAKALEYFISKGYEVYLPFGTATSCDLVVYKDGTCERVSVKTTRRKSRGNGWMVKIRQSGRAGEIPFDSTTSDILFIYVVPEDRIVIINSKDIKSKFEITIK